MPAPFPPKQKPPIRLIGVKQNCLKNITVEFPTKKITVVTGLSGSGKSSLAFDTLYAEGQRRYVESLSTYTRQFLEKMPKPEVDSIQNIPPAIALEQINHVNNNRSTVGTQTEVVDFLRLLFARIGRTFCLDCSSDSDDYEVKKLDSSGILSWALNWIPGKKVLVLAPLSHLAATQPTQEKVTKKTKKKKASAKKSPSKKPTHHTAVSLESLAEILQSQGFSRVLILNKDKKSNAPAELLDLAELKTRMLPPNSLQDGLVWVVIDRLRVTQENLQQEDTETRGRLLDSIDQAIAAGHGICAFYDLDSHEFKSFDQRFACTNCGREYKMPEPQLFSFNSPVGACSHCSGFGFTLDLDESLVVPDPSKTLKNGAIDPFSKPSFSDWQKDLFRFAERQGISIGKRYRELTATQKKLLWEGSPDDDTFPGILACFEELKKWKYKLHIRVFIRRYQNQTLCRVCHGARLKPEALAVKINQKNLKEILEQPVSNTHEWFKNLKLSVNEQKIAREIYSQVSKRLEFLDEVGVGYLTLSRLAKTLSGGEFQRIALATQLGNGLCGTLYVLDEPSIGLHAADTDRLIRVLKRLRDQGNTVVVVEHDLEVMRAADHLIELGPGAGNKGGYLVAQGTAAELTHLNTNSLTGRYLEGSLKLTRDRALRPPARRFIKIVGAREHNLKNITIEIPLDRLVVVTGMSGSGKSTLVHKTLHAALSRLFYRTPEMPGAYDRLYGAEQLSGVVLLDQTPIGKNSRSNPATYLKAWDEVRRIYANQVIALRRGYTPQHFSFNVDGGRCPVCKGEGEIALDMHFMAEVRLPCEECEGRRFKKSILDVSYRGKNISELLATTLDDAYELFRDNATLVRKIGILRSVGLGYLQMGQSSTTLSGGESQRLKIASVLDDRSLDNQLYIFDEPTTGLHLEDIKKLMTVIQDLVEAKHSVVMIEHHLDVIAQADWVIDLGPEGGEKGGALIAEGMPTDLVENPNSITGTMLKKQGYFPAPPPESQAELQTGNSIQD